jgi:hypothetical protein
MPRKRSRSSLKTVREWLPDYFSMVESTPMNEILADIAWCEVESAVDARNLVNRRIDNWVMWLNGTRPQPCPVEMLLSTMATQQRGSA